MNALSETVSSGKRRERFAFFKEIRKNGKLYLLTLPGILLILVFAYLPMGGIVIAFQDFNVMEGIAGSEFVGLRNFEFFVQSPDMLRIAGNTLYLNALFIVFSTLAAISIAVMLTEIGGRWFKRIAQSLVILPHFVSWTVVAMLLSVLLNTEAGLINQLLAAFGVDAVQFYSDPDKWPLILVLVKIWQGAGFGSIVYLATIAGINPDIYEAASIDGASRWQKIRFITLPLLKTTVILLTLLAMGGIFYGDFGMIYAIVGLNVLLYPTTDVIDTYVYRALMELGDLSMAAAVGFFQSVLGFILVITVNWLARRFSPDSAIF
ncbi:sugar ABC transporter permease [Paenibacillus sp. IB182496]|uniref:Sugar ABC transporter permease n=1 Tax=Paenibacillus sabuli TaxID=2772509 RepID=A0A927BYK3_9BACL|nr:ABC transporter permease subunit [Paenibacillus sabuli]MBD2848120.1 sugar ABC transporter permease [Paenibacillus sabuli]